jgi:hypothetical protein
VNADYSRTTNASNVKKVCPGQKYFTNFEEQISKILDDDCEFDHDI